MSRAGRSHSRAEERTPGGPAHLVPLAWALLLCSAPGCSWDQLNVFAPPTPPAPPADSFILKPEQGLVPEKPHEPNSPEARLAGAHELFRREEYAKAERVYHHLGDSSSNPPNLRQEAIYYEAECLRLQGLFPKAADVYASLLKQFVYSPYREAAVQHIYEIAQFWLQDTWAEMKEYSEYSQGKRWFYLPRFVSFDQKKPAIDREGRAVERLMDVRCYDGRGPYADKALCLMGYVSLYNENYRDADMYFSHLYQDHPQSKYANEALEKAIYCKQMIMGGPDYDGRKVAEARDLVDKGLRMPQLDPKAKEKLNMQLKGITLQQATQDYKKAQFYDRTNHPGAAYFYYEIVRRRYYGSDLAKQAAQRMREIHDAAEKDQASRPTATPNAAPPVQDKAPVSSTPLPDPGQVGAGMQGPH